jgi:hypothetical protein
MQGILPLEYLLAAPLESIVRAQAMAARATADFVGEVGFETDKDGVSRVRTVQFEYIHPQPDPDQPGNRLDLPVRVQVPVLSLFTIPNVAVDEATVEMQLRIATAQQQDPIKPTDGRRPVSGAAALRPNSMLLPHLGDRVRLIGAVTAPRSAEQTASLKVSIRMKQAPVPEGLAQILGLLGEATTARPTREQ